MHQILLPLDIQDHDRDDAFFVDHTNQQAWSWIQAWPQWPARGLFLYGPPGVGKSHMGRVWAKRAGAHIWSPSHDMSALYDAPSPHVLIDDVNAHTRTKADADHMLAAYNILCERKGSCLFLGSPPLFNTDTCSPDLISRLKTLITIGLPPPSDALWKKIMHNLFHKERLTVSEDVVLFLMRRLERSMGQTQQLVRHLASESLRHKRPVTIDLIKNVCEHIPAFS
ncbi:hypothetical protein EIL50_04295 [bacterium NHP-B]|nr:hypothetical protein EIL50_04295 [bacterium NHP-B]